MEGLKLMKKYIIFIFLIFSFSLNIFSSDISLNTDAVYGNDNYKKYSFSVEFSTDNYYLKPSYTYYSSDYLYSRSEFEFKAGYASEKLKLSGNIGYVPENDGYYSYSAGADICYYPFILENTEIGIGVFINYTSSNDSYISSTTYSSSKTKYKNNTLTRTLYYQTGETETGMYTELKYKVFNLNLSYSKTEYSNTVDYTRRPVQKSITSLLITDGYIEDTYSVSLSIDILENLSLDSDYTVSKYISKDYIRSVGIGVDKNFKSFSAGINYEYYTDGYSNETNNLYGLSVSVLF